jgi:DNA-binding NarL/FixJ family response regulator
MHEEKLMNRILLCEKNEFFRAALLRIIQCRFPHVDIKWVVSGEECLAETRDYRPDILFLGVNIYEGSELELLELLREKHPGVNIILFTDYSIEEYRKEAVLRGANHTISKDLWTGNEILALIQTILATKRKQADIEAGGSANEENLLKHPLERRRRDLRGKALERKYLARYNNRRRKGIRSLKTLTT